VSSYKRQDYPATELPVASDAAWDEYVEAIKFARGTLQRAQGDLSEIGDIPFSARPTRRGSAAA
jgi:hypothetical protein